MNIINQTVAAVSAIALERNAPVDYAEVDALEEALGISVDELRTDWCEHCVVIINIAKTVPLDYALPLYGFMMPLLVFLTTLTNIFVIIVLSRKHLRTPTNFVLVSMAIVDLLTGLTSLPWFIYYYTLRGFLADEHYGLSEFWCLIYPYLSYIVPTVWHTARIWLTVFLAIQRYVYVCVPNLVPVLCTPQRTRLFVLIIGVLAFATEMPDLFGKFMKRISLHGRGICTLRHYDWVLEIVGVQLFYSFIYWFRVAFVHILPCFLLIIFTFKLARIIKRSAARKRSSFASAFGSEYTSASEVVGHSALINGMKNHSRNSGGQFYYYAAATQPRTRLDAVSSATAPTWLPWRGGDEPTTAGPVKYRSPSLQSPSNFGGTFSSQPSAMLSSSPPLAPAAGGDDMRRTFDSLSAASLTSVPEFPTRRLSEPKRRKSQKYSNNERLRLQNGQQHKLSFEQQYQPQDSLLLEEERNVDDELEKGTKFMPPPSFPAPYSQHASASNSSDNATTIAGSTVCPPLRSNAVLTRRPRVAIDKSSMIDGGGGGGDSGTRHGALSSSSGRSLNATNRMLATICLVFLLLEVPAALIFMVHFLIAARYLPEVSDTAYFVLNVALIIRNILIVLTSPLQFFIYCSMSEQFRLTVRQLFTKRLLFVAQAQATFHGGKRYSLILVDVELIQQQRLRQQVQLLNAANSSAAVAAAGGGGASVAAQRASRGARRFSSAPQLVDFYAALDGAASPAAAAFRRASGASGLRAALVRLRWGLSGHRLRHAVAHRRVGSTAKRNFFAGAQLGRLLRIRSQLAPSRNHNNNDHQNNKNADNNNFKLVEY